MLLLKPLFLAASAAALVIIPEISEADEDIFRALPIDDTTATIPRVFSVDVPCQKCPGQNSKIAMHFAIEDEDRLMLNDYELWPGSDSPPPDLLAMVIEGDGRATRHRMNCLFALRPGDMDEDQHLQLLEMEVRVFEVDNLAIEDGPPVYVKMIRAAGGEIIIATVELGKTDGGSDDEDNSSDDKQCTSTLCRFEKLFGDAWERVKAGRKGCSGMQAHGSAEGDRKHPHGKSEHKNGSHKNGSHKNGSHKKGGHRKGGHHHHSGDNHEGGHHHSFLKMIKGVVLTVLLPIFMGIATGVSVAILTMSIGSLVVRFVRFLKGDRCESSLGSCHKAGVAEETVHEDEKSDLLANQDAPPQYEEGHPRN